MKKIFVSLILSIISFFNISANAAETISYIPQNPKYALIMIHGYGQSGANMQGMQNQLRNILPDTAIYFPTAPDRGEGVGGYQWFSIPRIGIDMINETHYEVMMKDALKNVQTIHNLVEEIHQTQNIPYANISVAGFSQGGLMAVLTGLTNMHQLDKIVSFSGVPLIYTKDFTLKKINHLPQTLVIQGDNDAIIPANSYQLTIDTLKNSGATPELALIHAMRHEINNKALASFKDFMMK